MQPIYNRTVFCEFSHNITVAEECRQMLKKWVVVSKEHCLEDKGVIIIQNKFNVVNTCNLTLKGQMFKNKANSYSNGNILTIVIAVGAGKQGALQAI